MESFNHNMLVEVALGRFRSVLGKWAPDSIAETTLFNVKTVPWKFRIICYVVQSMFMTGNPSSSKLYVNLYVSFMTHGSHEMSWNVISVFPDTGAHVMDTILWEEITVFNTCLQSRVDTLHVNQAPVFLYPCVRWQARGSRQRFVCKAAYPPSIAEAPQV